MSDKFDDETKEMLPAFTLHHGEPPVISDVVVARAVVAARLRADGEIIACLRHALDGGYKGAYDKAQSEFAVKLAQAQAEIGRLKTVNELWHKRLNLWAGAEDEIAALRGEVGRLEKQNDEFSSLIVEGNTEINALRSQLAEAHKDAIEAWKP